MCVQCVHLHLHSIRNCTRNNRSVVVAVNDDGKNEMMMITFCFFRLFFPLVETHKLLFLMSFIFGFTYYCTRTICIWYSWMRITQASRISMFTHTLLSASLCVFCVHIFIITLARFNSSSRHPTLPPHFARYILLYNSINSSCAFIRRAVNSPAIVFFCCLRRCEKKEITSTTQRRRSFDVLKATIWRCAMVTLQVSVKSARVQHINHKQ